MRAIALAHTRREANLSTELLTDSVQNTVKKVNPSIRFITNGFKVKVKSSLGLEVNVIKNGVPPNQSVNKHCTDTVKNTA